jgi:hypothetical protein
VDWLAAAQAVGTVLAIVAAGCEIDAHFFGAGATPVKKKPLYLSLM